MSAISNYLETALVNAILRATNFTAPTAVYVALHTADPTETGTVGEVSGSGYVRKVATFISPSDGVTSNFAVVTWTASGGNYGTVSHVSIWDASSAGNCLLKGALAASKVVNDGDTVEFLAAALVASLA